MKLLHNYSIPGSKIYNKFNRQKLSELTFTQMEK